MTRVLMVVLCALLLLCACDPDSVPRLSPDGKHIALLRPSKSVKPTEGEKSPLDLTFMDVATKKEQAVVLPDQWTAQGFCWAGEKILLTASRPLKPEAIREGGPKAEVSNWLVDPAEPDARKRLARVKLPLSFPGPFVARHKGKDAIFCFDVETRKTRVYSIDGAKEISVDSGELVPAGRGWTMRKVSTESKGIDPVVLIRVELIDAEGRAAGRIEADEVAKACSRGVRQPVCAVVSPDEKTVLLGFETETIFTPHPHAYTFGLFDVATGKFLWTASANAMYGLPMIKDGRVYVLEDIAKRSGGRYERDEGVPPQYVMASYVKGSRTEVVKLPFAEGDEGRGHSPLPDGRGFLVQIHGSKPRLLIVPLAHGDKIETLELAR